MGADKRDVPRSDVIINYPNGSFVIVKCDEDTQRQFYWHPEECRYLLQDQWVYRLLSLCCTLLLMAGVIFLANADISLQLGYAIAYFVLNAAYWIVAALPVRWHWDLSAFKLNPIKFDSGIQLPPKKDPTFTQALWQAIAITRASGWARDFGIAPKSAAWDEWLKEAAQKAQAYGENRDKDGKLQLPEWNAAERLSKLLKHEEEQQKIMKQA